MSDNGAACVLLRSACCNEWGQPVEFQTAELIATEFDRP